jgi:hypothetical protein
MTKFTDKVLKYNTRMKNDLKLTDVHTCGIWGNLGTETGGFTALQEKNPTVKGSRGGYGWLQWTGPRRVRYEAWCKAKGLNPADDESNYTYFIHETLTDEWKSLAQVRKTTTIEAATETFMKLNLRPGIPHLENRYSWARKAQDALKLQKTTQVASGAVVAAGASAAALTWWEQLLPYWPAFLAVGVALAVFGVMYLINKDN